MNVSLTELAGYGTALTALGGMVGYVSKAWVQGRKFARDVAVQTRRADAEERVAEGREDTAQRRIAAEDAARVDSIAVDVAKRDRAERIDAQHEHVECLKRVAGLEVKLAVCETKHENAEARNAWLEERLTRIDGGPENNPSVPAPPIPKKPTPPGGNPRVEKETQP